MLFLKMGSDKQIKRGSGAAYVRMRPMDRKWSFAKQRELVWRFAKRRGIVIVAEYGDGGGSNQEGGGVDGEGA